MKQRAVLGILLVFFLETGLSAQERFRRDPPYPEPLASLVLPEIQSWTLSNGLEMSLVRVPDIPRLCMQLAIYTGDASSPPELPGLASFTAKMIGRASNRLSPNDVEEAIDAMGGEFAVRTFPDYTLFSLTFLEEHIDAAIGLLAELLLNPAYNKTDLDNVKRTMSHGLIRRYADSEFLGGRLLKSLLFEKHGYAGTVYTEHSLRNIDRKAIQMFFEKFYRPNNAHLTIIGNLSINSASRHVSRHLNTWKSSSSEIHHFSPPEPNQRLRICFLSLPHSRDAFIAMGNILPSKTSSDVFPLQVFNQVMGGSHISRLFMNLREAKGFAYWAYSSMEFHKSCGVFSVRARVRPESVSNAVQEILDLLRIASGQPFPAQELEQSKSFLIGHYPITLMTHEELADRVSEIKVFGLGPEHWNEYIRSIMYVDARMVFETARKIPFDKPVIVIVGDPETVLDRLQVFEEVEVYDHKGTLLYRVKKEN